ncbi:MAG: ribosome-associated translation inhibitor RaiA [Alphaproteobacteria bacterium]|nr:ribosome-associated translation inhibitor RaiA [Alphaproteobacteria bacterium]MCY4607176.1 ribosome-associated translation inhibitor RaiA [bacterium]
MNISITGHQTDVSETLRHHVEQVLGSAIDKYFADSLSAHVTFSREAQSHRVHISVHVGHDINAEGHGDGLTASAAFGKAMEHVAKQLRRNKRKLREHH